MPSFVKTLILSLIAGSLLASCNPLSKEKGDLRFTDNTLPMRVAQEPKLEATYESVYHHFIKKSCLDCHNANSGRVSFETKQDVIDNAEDILFYTEFGCDLGSCMPERDQNDQPLRPVPTEEIIEAFRTWSESL